MNALRRQNIRPQQTFEKWTPRTQESPRELARESEAKRKQAPQMQSQNPILKKPPLLIAQDTQHKLGVAFSYLERNRNNSMNPHLTEDSRSSFQTENGWEGIFNIKDIFLKESCLYLWAKFQTSQLPL